MADGDKLERLRKQRTQLDARIKAAETRQKQTDRKTDTRRKIIVGGAVLAHAALHPAFAEALREVLRVAVVREADKQAVADLLGDGG
jgi:hypothetical protein